MALFPVINTVFDRIFEEPVYVVPDRRRVPTDGCCSSARRVARWHISHPVENEAVIEGELPGVRAEDVSVELKEEGLVISGHWPVEDASDPSAAAADLEGDKKPTPASFNKVFNLADGVTENHIHAKYVDGLLRVTVTRPEPVQQPRKQINIARL
eukprot:Clim_evm41s242 gene=Clim_evmTU41s242